MESVLGRYRNLIVLVGVLFAQILGLAVQVKRTTSGDSESTRLIRVWAVSAVTPLEKALVWTQTSTWNLWHNYFYLRGVRAENRNLRAQIEQMRIEQVRLTQDAEQARRLQALLNFKEQFISRTIAAQVIGGSGSELSRSIYIDKGSRDGILPDMSVITGDGIVGKVLRVYRSTSEVLRIDDQSSGVGAILEQSRTQGILRGTAGGELMLEKVMSDETVPVGETVLTSGGDGIFPKGLPIGHVTKVKPGSELFLNIGVRPAADLSRLEEVLVVVKIDEKQAEPDQSGAARAVDILAERLPTVPKPAVPAAGAATTSPAGSGVAPSSATAGGSNGGSANVIRKPASAAASPTGAKPAANSGVANQGAIANTPATPPVAKPDSTAKPKAPPEASLTQAAAIEAAAGGSVAATPKPVNAAGPASTTPAAVKSAPVKSSEQKSTQSSPPQPESTQAKPAQPKPIQTKPVQPRPAQQEPAAQDSPH
jgi:rod shape-determining protein MreC